MQASFQKSFRFADLGFAGMKAKAQRKIEKDEVKEKQRHCMGKDEAFTVS